MFRVGQKVVCVKGKRSVLVKGSIYTVSKIHPLGIAVVEISGGNPISGFFFHRFRPVVNRKTDISIFTKMLKPSRVDA